MQILHEVFEKGAYANLALDRFLRTSGLEPRDRHLVTEIVNGSVRMMKHLDWVLDSFMQKGIEKQNPWMRTISRMTLYQILFMDKIPQYAVVNDAVALARRTVGPVMARVVNGVMRNIIRNRDNLHYPEDDDIHYLAVFYSHPEWLVRRWVESFGRQETQRMLIRNNRPPEVVLRCNRLKSDRQEAMQVLQQEGIQAHSSVLTPWGIRFQGLSKPLASSHAYQKGYFYIQNDASMLAAAILGPEPGSLVYDLCCGVGGKATHLAEWMEDQGRIKACDVYENKLQLLQENCRRLGIHIINGEKQDVLTIHNEKTIPAPFVLLDAPCSGWGVLSRRSDARWRIKEAEVAVLPELQQAMLQHAGTLVCPGGLLLYSTCTINREENEAVVNHLLDAGRFILQGFEDRISFFPLDDGDREQAARGMLTLLPGKYEHCDGMFYALMRRKQ